MMKQDKEVLNTSKVQYLSHIMRNTTGYFTLQNILHRKVIIRRVLGRRRIIWLKDLRTWFSVTTIDYADNRQQINDTQDASQHPEKIRNFKKKRCHSKHFYMEPISDVNTKR